MSARKTTAGTTASGFDAQSFLDSAGVAKRIVDYRRNEVIFAPGEPGDSVFYIQQGGVKLSVVSKTGKEAVRALKRQLSNIVYRHLVADAIR